jgi:hypothetical protein
MNFCRSLLRVSRVIDLSVSITNDKKDGRYIRMASTVGVYARVHDYCGYPFNYAD